MCFDAGDHANTRVRNNLVLPRHGTIASGIVDVGIVRAGNVFARPGDVEDVLAPGAGTFRLTADSYRPRGGAAIVDKGVASSARDDIAGTPRPQGRAVDVGAYEIRT
jgi:hypothetical protein